MAFRLNCVSELYKNLGKYDAIVEFTELSVREFIKEAEKAKDFDSYLSSKSSELKIKIDTVDKSIYRSRISQSYILSVYQNAELFIHQFRDECNHLKNSNWKLDDTKENLLIKTIRKITNINSATKLIGEHRLAIFNYYRVIRNKYSHDRIEDTKVEKEYLKVLVHKAEINNDYPNLNAPNDFDNISFDDFILFSRIVKDIAYILSDIIIPNNEELKSYYLRMDLFKELNQNPERKNNAIKGHMNNTFGIEIEQAEEIIKLILCH